MKKNYYKPQKQEIFYRRNQRIFAKTLRVVGKDGVLIGVLPLQKALEMAYEQNVDLIEIAPNAVPPVAKLADYNQFIYQQNKKKRAGKPKKTGDAKELWLTPFIADNDLAVRVERGKELLKESGKLKVLVRFRRRQMDKKSFGFTVMNKFIAALGDVHIDKQPQFMGYSLIAILSKK